jgi:hypothetical protein
MSKVGIIGDPHEPVCHPGYLAFCCDTFDAWGCDRFVCIGDIADNHAISFHAHHPECPGPSDEFELTLWAIQKWVDAFPELDMCIGNHDRRHIRLAESVNIPSKFLRDYAEIWGTPGWNWANEHTIDDVYYFHGEGCGGMHPAFNIMKKIGMSCVMGHVHTAGGVKWLVNPNNRWFGMDTGCGIDDTAAAFEYGRHFKQRSVLSCGVVLDGIPYHEIMPCGRGEKYDRNKFTKRTRK